MVKDWIDDRKRWLVLAMMKWALRLHEETFIMLCKITVMDISMRENGISHFTVEEDEHGNERIVPVRDNATRH